MIKQGKSPSGLIGKVITKIWSSYFYTLSKWTLNLIKIKNNSSILEIGYGGGINIKNIMTTHPSVTIFGIDTSNAAFRTASSLNQTYINQNRVKLLVKDIASLRSMSTKFDIIFAIQKHIYWDNLNESLAQCLNNLTPDGTFVITCEIDKINYHLPKLKNHTVFKNLLLITGFSKVKIIHEGNYIAFICTK